jgi:RNA polymerase sigma-70 factor (ECF subfamily)
MHATIAHTGLSTGAAVLLSMRPDMTEMASAVDLAELLQLVADGDRAAFRRLYDAQAARLFGVALRITRQSPLAADAVHDALLQVWHHAARFDVTRGNAQTWLLTLVRYRALDIVRRRAREAPEEAIPEAIDESPDPLAQLAGSRNAVALHRCLGQLQEDRRRLVTLAFVEGLSHSEAADRVGLPLGTVKSAIRRSLRWLRTCLESGA